MAEQLNVDAGRPVLVTDARVVAVTQTADTPALSSEVRKPQLVLALVSN